jgi:hypothetical protein
VQPLRHVLRFAVAFARQRPLEIPHAGVLVGSRMTDQREPPEIVRLQARTSMRPPTSRTSKMRSGS